MAPPAYHSIKNAEIEEFALENGKLWLLAGEYAGRKGHMGKYLPLDYYDIHMLYLLKKDEINWKALNESLQATMIKRETVDLLDDYSSVLMLIEADDNLQKLWIRYQDKNSYVGNISFNETIQSVKAVLDRIILSV